MYTLVVESPTQQYNPDRMAYVRHKLELSRHEGIRLKKGKGTFPDWWERELGAILHQMYQRGIFGRAKSRVNLTFTKNTVTLMQK